MNRRLTLLGACLALSMCAVGNVAAGILDALENLGDNSGFGSDKEFLDPEVAFRFTHAIEPDETVRLNWDIAPGYYLYRDKFAAKSNVVGVRVGELYRPNGVMKDDPDFGDVEIYRHEAGLRAPITFDSDAPRTAALEVTYQGCAEDGICYPPIKKSIDVLLDALVTPVNAAASTDSVSDNPGTAIMSADAIAARLESRSIFVIAGTFFIFGLLLAFTPCVFPMVPILSGIIVGQEQPVSVKRGLILSAVYVFAVAVTYAIVGLLAGLFGHNLQATFQQPALLIAFSLVFVALALSMFGFYELQLPAGVQTRLDQYSRSRDGGNLAGVGVMGVLSAIIVGPCVAPPIAGALIYLGHQGSPVIGGTALFAMGLGMGMPLLLVGASAGKLLPRAGVWMDTVKRVFGVMLLGVAIWFLERVLPGPTVLLLWALLIIVSAIFMGALDQIVPASSGWRRLFKGVGLAMLCYGAILIVGAGVGAQDPFRPLNPLIRPGSEAHALAFEPIKGVAGLAAGLERARVQGRPALLDFYADWCVECKYLERDTFAHPSVKSALSDVVLLRADVTANDELDQALLKNFELFGPPAVLFFDLAGAEKRTGRVLGFVGPADFSAHLARIFASLKL
jgi:thiol:disulfide interchange protein DsbD